MKFFKFSFILIFSALCVNSYAQDFYTKILSSRVKMELNNTDDSKDVIDGVYPRLHIYADGVIIGNKWILTSGERTMSGSGQINKHWAGPEHNYLTTMKIEYYETPAIKLIEEVIDLHKSARQAFKEGKNQEYGQILLSGNLALLDIDKLPMSANLRKMMKKAFNPEIMIFSSVDEAMYYFPDEKTNEATIFDCDGEYTCSIKRGKPGLIDISGDSPNFPGGGFYVYRKTGPGPNDFDPILVLIVKEIEFPTTKIGQPTLLKAAYEIQELSEGKVKFVDRFMRPASIRKFGGEYYIQVEDVSQKIKQQKKPDLKDIKNNPNNKYKDLNSLQDAFNGLSRG
ncbi:hypothetical protein Dip510_002134 [Elusimicrobium posterum]|uniref:hypothetical protein n=1 Tax=Elusimicrobium posterum TaxID=3116653 RepID=UPI003C71BEC3